MYNKIGIYEAEYEAVVRMYYTLNVHFTSTVFSGYIIPNRLQNVLRNLQNL